MRIYRGLPTIQSGIATKRRKFWLIAASTLASAFLGMSEPALAQVFPPDIGPPDNAIATPLGNNYPGGINVNTDNGSGGAPINLTLEPGVNVVIPAGAGSFNAVNAANTGGVTAGSADITFNVDGVTINNTANPFYH